MENILVAVDGTPNSVNPIERAMARWRMNGGEIHLLNVRPPLPRDAARFIDSGLRRHFHRERGEAALARAGMLLDRANIPYHRHIAIGDKARTISDFAGRHGCDLIILGASRKNALVRFLESSVVTELLLVAKVPVEVVVGEPARWWERYGVPAGVGLALLTLAVE